MYVHYNYILKASLGLLIRYKLYYERILSYFQYTLTHRFIKRVSKGLEYLLIKALNNILMMILLYL